MSNCDCQDPIKDVGNFNSNFDCRKNIGNGQIITTVAATTAKIFFAPRAVGIEQNALLVSTAFRYLLSFTM